MQNNLHLVMLRGFFTVMAKFVDVPEALTCGRDETEALRLAQEALVLALTEGYMAIRLSVPPTL